jgi:hypothetical protein
MRVSDFKLASCGNQPVSLLFWTRSAVLLVKEPSPGAGSDGCFRGTATGGSEAVKGNGQRWPLAVMQPAVSGVVYFFVL